MTRKCVECKGKMIEHVAKTPEGVEYRYWKCVECGEEIVDMKQLHEIAEKYRKMKTYQVTISKWGTALAVRIPKDVADKQKIRVGEKAFVIPERVGFRVVREED